MAPLSRLLTCRRLTLVVLVAVVLLLFLSPGADPGRRQEVIDYVRTKGSAALDAAPALNPFKNGVPWGATPAPAAATPAPSGQTTTLLSTIRERPALHPDGTKTTRCETPRGTWVDAHARVRPLVQYALMVDAGSTGSRVHVYKVSPCPSSAERIAV